MPNSRKKRASSTYENRRNNYYIEGSAAPRIELEPEIGQPRKALSVSARRNREKAHHMSLGYVVFLVAALLVAGFFVLQYLQLQSKLTSEIKMISSMESRLNKLKMDNDEEYNRILNSVDLEEVKRVAIGELGMVYASEGQIVMYESVGNDYMRKVAAND